LSLRLGSLLSVALYRKYRPATFAEVVGQEHVTEPLSTALAAGRINHAYLFSGPRGCGKTSSARILARSLNCEQGPTANPCGVCDSCVALAPNGPGSVDVTELDAASHGGVDDTRELRDRAFYAPAQSRYRIFIVDEAHMVTTAGFNALLKIVEEPPEHLIFVFATTEPEKVLPTIRSRTHHYPFRLLAPRTMRALLERICAQEDVEVDDAVYPLVIRAGGGSPRDTLSVLDQLLAGAEGNRVAYPRALALLGATDVALIDDAVDALLPDVPYRAVGNLPYNVGTPILRRVVADPNFRRAVFMLQKEVANRIVARPGDDDYGFLTLYVRLFASARTLMTLDPGSFYPMPKVRSAVVVLDPDRKPYASEELIDLISQSFRMRRKKLVNNLTGWRGYSREQVLAAMERAAIDANARAETLGTETFARLAGEL